MDLIVKDRKAAGFTAEQATAAAELFFSTPHSFLEHRDVHEDDAL